MAEAPEHVQVARDPPSWPPTKPTKLNVRFLRPVRPGRIIGKGRVVHRAGDIAFLEATLTEPDGVAIVPRPAPSPSTGHRPRRDAHSGHRRARLRRRAGMR
ncbi:hotdog domain-containing protein [Streptomyces coffeae]|uniref:hotdog domain-containing protein n=1 Tax=Streptomyces coffeae TaxID=621382 RepID=UPI00355664EA